MIYIGIDNGLSGGLVALNESKIIAKMVMPTRGTTKGNEVEPLVVWGFVMNVMNVAMTTTGREDVTVLLETPGKHSPGVMALCSMWDSYGALRSILEIRRIRHHRIAPVTWQKAMLGNCGKGNTKPAALAKAKQLWPGQDWKATARCTKPHDGMIDAALIAEYGRTRNL